MQNSDSGSAVRLLRPDGAVGLQRRAGPEDSELILQALAGSRTAWQLLVDRYLPTVWGLARRATGDAAAAGVVSQVVWLRLVQSLAHLGPEPLAMWLAAAVDEEAHRHRGMRDLSGVVGRSGQLRSQPRPPE